MEKDKKKEDVYCPVSATIDLLEKRWTLDIVMTLLTGKKRFNALGTAIGGCNSRTLAKRLKALEKEMLVRRLVLSHIPPWVEYELTEKGRSLTSIVDSIALWGRKWMTKDLT